MTVKIFSRFKVPDSVGFSCKTPSMTQQHFKEDADINNIVKRSIASDPVPPGMYMDLTQVKDLQGAYDTINFAEESFMNLPSEVRQRFNQSPVELFNFVNNPANFDEGVKLGLFVDNRPKSDMSKSQTVGSVNSVDGNSEQPAK